MSIKHGKKMLLLSPGQWKMIAGVKIENTTDKWLRVWVMAIEEK